jgi:hypothetical protein
MTDNTLRDAFTEAEEGLEQQFYLDAGGVAIGYGFNLSVNSGIAIDYLVSHAGGYPRRLTVLLTQS